MELALLEEGLRDSSQDTLFGTPFPKIILSEGLLGNICLPGMLDFQYSDINIKQILGHHDLNYFDSWAWTGRQFVNWRT